MAYSEEDTELENVQNGAQSSATKLEPDTGTSATQYEDVPVNKPPALTFPEGGLTAWLTVLGGSDNHLWSSPYYRLTFISKIGLWYFFALSVPSNRSECTRITIRYVVSAE